MRRFLHEEEQDDSVYQGDASDSSADDHAEQAPGGKRPHQGAWIGVIRPKSVCDEHVCRVDDHEVVAIENHCKGKQHEHEPGVFVHSKGVDNFETVYSLLFMSPSSFASSLLLGWSVHLLEVVYVCALEYAK